MRHQDLKSLRRAADVLPRADLGGGGGKPPRRNGGSGGWGGGGGRRRIPDGKCLYERPTPIDIVCMMFALFPPPLAVYIHAGRGPDLACNVALTLCGYLPGVIHAYWVLARR